MWNMISKLNDSKLWNTFLAHVVWLILSILLHGVGFFSPPSPPANRDCWDYVENYKIILIVKRIILKVINRLNKLCAYTIFVICQCPKTCMDLNKQINAAIAMIKNKVLLIGFAKKTLVSPTKKWAEWYSFL